MAHGRLFHRLCTAIFTVDRPGASGFGAQSKRGCMTCILRVASAPSGPKTNAELKLHQDFTGSVRSLGRSRSESKLLLGCHSLPRRVIFLTGQQYSRLPYSVQY
jgi:hypothetical protein